MNTPTITIFGIPNCDTVKKARAWLDAAGLPYHFHDFKKHGVPPDLLAHWTATVGWDNPRSTWDKKPTERPILSASSLRVYFLCLRRSWIRIANAAISSCLFIPGRREIHIA